MPVVCKGCLIVFFVACGASRLARYNVTAERLSEGGDKVKYFEGTPIPTLLLLVVCWYWLFGRVRLVSNYGLGIAVSSFTR
jgi:CDP-diacylglycerol--serine O-phosphatidyltransferase